MKHAILSNMDAPRDDHIKRSESPKERDISCITYIWNPKFDTNEPVLKQKPT